MIKKYNTDKYGLYVIKKLDIEFEIEELLKRYDPDLLSKPMELDIEDFTENFLHLNLEYHSLSSNEKYFGAFAFNDGYIDTYDDNIAKKIFIKAKTVIIDPIILKAGEHLHRFTLGHEDSHFIFQYDAYKNEITIDKEQSQSLNELLYYSHSEKRLLKTKDDWAEWQANYASGCLLMNRSASLKLLSQLLNRDVQFGDGFFSKVGVLTKWFLQYEFVKTFNVSEKAAWIRLNELSD